MVRRNKMKYRKKPVVVEVYQYRKPLYELDVFNNLPDWMKQARQNGTLYYYQGRYHEKA